VLGYHQILGMTRFVNLRQVLFSLLKFNLILLLFALVVFSPSVIKTFPAFQIKKVASNVNNAKINQLINQILEKDFNKNIVFVLTNLGLFRELLQKKSFFYIKNVEISSFSPFSGTLNLKIITRRPIAILNKKYFVGQDRYLFKNLENKTYNLLSIDDTSGQWHFGALYKEVNLDTLIFFYKNYNMTHAKVNKELIELESIQNKLFLRNTNLNKDQVNYIAQTIEALNKLFRGKKEIEFFGKKAIYVKIIKESTNE